MALTDFCISIRYFANVGFSVVFCFPNESENVTFHQSSVQCHALWMALASEEVLFKYSSLTDRYNAANAKCSTDLASIINNNWNWSATNSFPKDRIQVAFSTTIALAESHDAWTQIYQPTHHDSSSSSSSFSSSSFKFQIFASVSSMMIHCGSI